MNKKNNKWVQLNELRKKADVSLQYLINEIYQILENPIILYDADWKILARAENVITDDPFWNNHVNDGNVSNNINTFLSEGFLDTMLGPDKVMILKSEKVKYDRIFGKIFDQNSILLGGISIVASNKPFEDDDIWVAESICKMLSKEICKSPYYQNYAQSKLETCINMLIERDLINLEDRLNISGYVEMLYSGLKDYLYMAVADISQCDPTYAKLDYYKDLFKRIRPAFKYSRYSNYIVIIISVAERIFYPKKVFSRLNKIFEQDNIKVGISRRFENLYELSKYYNEAVKALNNGLKQKNGQCIFVYDVEDEPLNS